MSATAAPLPSGFREPVFDSQRAFRAAMEALANPGRIRPAGAGLEAAPLTAAAAALALALCDYETPLFLAPSVAARQGAIDYLRFYTDAPLTASPAEAAIAILDLAQDELDLGTFAQGVPEYPDRSTTVIALCASLTDGSPLTITGPGIARTAELRVVGLPNDFTAQWSANRSRFPLGVDIVFAASDSIVGLPRSARILAEAG